MTSHSIIESTSVHGIPLATVDVGQDTFPAKRLDGPRFILVPDLQIPRTVAGKPEPAEPLRTPLTPSRVSDDILRDAGGVRIRHQR